MFVLARDARAFSSEATDWMASRALASSPRTARSPLLALEVGFALADLRTAQEQDPEAAEARRRCAWSATESGVLQPQGGALAEFHAAQQSLTESWARSDDAGAAGALARLVQAACDLADPFAVTIPDAGEPDGARVWFSEELATGELATLTAAALPQAADPALELARSSAALRADVMAAVEAGDEAAVEQLRSAQLAAGLALAEAGVRSASLAASTVRSGRLQLEPSPLRGAPTMHLTLEQAADAKLELFDVSGRRVLARELGFVAAGERRQSLPEQWFAGLPAGLYLARVQAGASHAEVRVTLLRD